MEKMREKDYLVKALELIAMAIKGARLGDAEVCPVCGRKMCRIISDEERARRREQMKEVQKLRWPVKQKKEGSKSNIEE